MRRPRLLDLFCGAGGSARGYQQAGFHVTGVDNVYQKHYAGDDFIPADALMYAFEHGHRFDAIHASPPCQRFSKAQVIRGRLHPDLITPTRVLLRDKGVPYVIENVVGSPLVDPILLCGMTFGLRVYRHRLFESNFELPQPEHSRHIQAITKMGRVPQPDEFMHVVGHFSGVREARKAMGIDWMGREELREAIPPAYTEWVGLWMKEQLEAARCPIAS